MSEETTTRAMALEVARYWGGLALQNLAAEAPELFVYLMTPHLLWVWFAKVGTGTVVDAIKDRDLRRLDSCVQALIVEHNFSKDQLAKLEADLFVEMRSICEHAVKGTQAGKIRALIELANGQLDPERAVAKDKYYRFKRWIEELDLLVLDSFSQHTVVNDPKVRVPGTIYEDDNGRNPQGSTEYLFGLLKKNGPTRFEFISQLSGVGVLYFDRGGGAATFNEAAHVIWHRDSLDFAVLLRDSRKLSRFVGLQDN